MGSFVPAKRAVVGVADRLFARVGATDNVTKHMSTFHVEMAETANILATATRHSFVVLDEIGTHASLVCVLQVSFRDTVYVCLLDLYFFQFVLLISKRRISVVLSGRGTSATEGLAIAESVIEHLSNAIGIRLYYISMHL